MHLGRSDEEAVVPEIDAELDELADLFRGGIGHLLPVETDGPFTTMADADSLVDEDVLAARMEFEILVGDRARTAWMPVVVREETAHPVSKYFGAPWMDDDEEWPRIAGHDALFVLQLDVASLPARYSRLLGGRGLIQFFWVDPETEVAGAGRDQDAMSIVRFVRPHLRNGRNRIGPVPWYARKPKVVVGWEAHRDMPHSVELEAMGIGPDEISSIAARHGVREKSVVVPPLRGDKLGGWPSWSKGDDRPTYRSGKGSSLYQIDSGAVFGDGCLPTHAPGLFATNGTGHVFLGRHGEEPLLFRWAAD
jgi:hypothetical protein